MFGGIVAKKVRVLMALPTWGEGAVNPGYTCRTPCDVFTLFFMVRSHRYSQQDMAELFRNSGLKLTCTLHPPVHTVLFSTAQEDGEAFSSFRKNASLRVDFPGHPRDAVSCVGVSTPQDILTPSVSQCIFSCHGCRHW